ncbi:MAG TPA: beta-N-acetylhexosaminidase [Micromonosporaceae bacterium]
MTATLGLIPVPARVRRRATAFELGPRSEIQTFGEGADVVGQHLAELLRPATGFALPVSAEGAAGPSPAVAPGTITLALVDAASDDRVEVVGTGPAGDRWAADPEGYRLDVDALIVLRASAAAGLFRGIQTLRQLLPAAVERADVQPGPWLVPGASIEDWPRLPYRGLMLDVARRFLSMAEVKHLTELAARYKLNHLHLHLTDDQGWRIAVDSWPRLARYGGGTEVGEGPGGFYAKADYREIVRYAQARHITVVPEVDVPGHTNAALAAYPELTCDGAAPARYRGIDVGFSALCAANPLTYRFLDEVFGELAALTPGPYLHIGGDEALTLPAADYAAIVDHAHNAVRTSGKQVIGWHETAGLSRPPQVLQYWGVTPRAPAVLAAAAAGAKVIMSPGDRAYLDMKYDQDSRLGLSWAGYLPVNAAYDWDPAGHLPGLAGDAVLGLEALLWTETVHGVADLEYLAFPRLPALAELGWSAASGHGWPGFRQRLAAQAPRWAALGLSYFAAPDVPWLVPGDGSR